MTTLKCKTVIGGKATGEALVTEQPINFTAAMCKVPNMLPSKRAEVNDAHHELFKQNVAGKVLVFPSCIGSTHTGLVLLELVSRQNGPAALVVRHNDSLLISGVVLSDVWFGKTIPVVEYHGDDLFEQFHTGDRVTVDGDAGEIRITRQG